MPFPSRSEYERFVYGLPDSSPDVIASSLRLYSTSAPAFLPHLYPALPNKRIHDKTGIDLIYIPSGPFLYGSAIDDNTARKNEKLQRTIDLPAYWIGRAPVRNDQFARFVSATDYKTTAECEGYGWGRLDGKWGQIKGADWIHPNGLGTSIAEKGSHPVIQISWDDAQAFCEWAGLTLPTGMQWEKAARGTDGRNWPWGNEPPTAEHCNFDWTVGDTTPVGTYSPKGDSPYGCVDTAGNVWEWVTSGHDKDQTPFLRGGTWNSLDATVRSAYRLNYTPDKRHDIIGFRVVELLSDPGF